MPLSQGTQRFGGKIERKMTVFLKDFPTELQPALYRRKIQLDHVHQELALKGFEPMRNKVSTDTRLLTNEPRRGKSEARLTVLDLRRSECYNCDILAALHYHVSCSFGWPPFLVSMIAPLFCRLIHIPLTLQGANTSL